jgi:hypothetical protein
MDKQTKARNVTLSAWMHDRNARCMWQQRITSGRGGMLECYVANGRVLLVHWYPDEEGWELYIAASVSNKTDATLEAADAYLKSEG